MEISVFCTTQFMCICIMLPLILGTYILFESWGRGERLKPKISTSQENKSLLEKRKKKRRQSSFKNLKIMKIPGVGWLRAGGGTHSIFSFFFNLKRKIYASTDKMKILAPRIDKSLRSIHVNDLSKSLC